MFLAQEDADFTDGPCITLYPVEVVLPRFYCYVTVVLSNGKTQPIFFKTVS
jgi:hypothetical protein